LYYSTVYFSIVLFYCYATWHKNFLLDQYNSILSYLTISPIQFMLYVLLANVVFPPRMVTDVQLAIFANMLGVSLFLLVVLYHYVAVNNPKKLE